MTDEQKDMLRRAHKAQKARIYGESWDVKAVKAVLEEHTKALLTEVVQHINAIRPEDFGEAVLCQGAETLYGDLVAWRAGVCSGVRKCDDYDGGGPEWYWEFPNDRKNAVHDKDPIECLIGMVEALEAIHEGQVP